MIRYVSTYELKKYTEGASGYDLRAMISIERVIEPGGRWLVPSGVYLDMPLYHEAQVRSRSGLALNHGVVVLNAPGTIDSDYRGEIKVLLYNSGTQPWVCIPGERIAQLVFFPLTVELQRLSHVGEMSETARGASGHGSTGR